MVNDLRVAAVVLAGGLQDALSKSFGVSHKALIPIYQKPMAYYVLRALRESSRVQSIIYVGEVDKAFADFVEVAVPSGRGMAESLSSGAGATQGKFDYYLILSADMPWLTPEAIDALIDQSPQVDLVYSIISKTTLEAVFPGQKRTYVRIQEGWFTGGNVVLVSREGLPKLLRVLNQLHQNRKNPIGLAWLFGLDMILKLVLGRLKIPELEARASRILDLQAKAFIAKDASLGADVDKLEHLQSDHIQKIKP